MLNEVESIQGANKYAWIFLFQLARKSKQSE